MPPGCELCTTRPWASIQPVNPPLASSGSTRHARTVSVSALTQTPDAVSNAALSTRVNSDSARIRRRIVPEAIVDGLKVGSRYCRPTLGWSPSATASGTSVGRTIGPFTAMRWLSAFWFGPLVSA